MNSRYTLHAKVCEACKVCSNYTHTRITRNFFYYIIFIYVILKKKETIMTLLYIT